MSMFALEWNHAVFLTIHSPLEGAKDFDHLRDLGAQGAPSLWFKDSVPTHLLYEVFPL